MKLISLNTYGGRLLDPLLHFIKEKAFDTDIFCFQEVFMGRVKKHDSQGIRLNLLAEIKSILKRFDYYIYQAPKGSLYFQNAHLKVPYGIAVFVKKTHAVKKSGGFMTWKKSLIPEEKIEPSNGNFLHLEVKTPNKNFILGNFHGFLTHDSGKADSPVRTYQAEKISTFFKSKSNSYGKILIGDFNLHPGAEGIKIIGKSMKNLTKEYQIKSTRNSNYKDMEKYKDYIADYCFVSKSVGIKNFKVLPDIVSDHQPLYLEFD